jgi:hypothetical protein
MSGHLGLGISILSYAGGVMVGVAADAGLVPDPDRLVVAFQRELKLLMDGEPKPAPKPARKRVAARKS